MAHFHLVVKRAAKESIITTSIKTRKKDAI
jgi:hypothetical protein